MKSEQLLSLIAAAFVLLIALLYVSFQAAPQFTTYLLLLLFVAFGFILTEQWKTHDAAEFENRFWTTLAFCFSATCLFCKDSPLRFSEDRRGIAWSIVCLCTYLCHIYDRDVRRLFLTRVNFIRKQRSADFNAENRAQAKLKVVQLKKLTAAIDQRWVSSTFLNIFFLSYVLSAEDQILNVLSEANRDELNLIINDNHFELALILYKVKDHWVCKRYHRTKLLQLLARERIKDLNVRARVVLLDAMQRLGVSAQSSLEEYVKNIILSTKGDELSDLKCLMDSKGDIFSMHYLVFVQLRNPAIKSAILEHIAIQARIQSSLMGSLARRRNTISWRKVLSDIDDTLLSSGGSFPKGVDIMFPKQSIYPGVLAFYRELNLGTSGEDNAERLRHGDLAFISARPHVYKDVSESATYSKIRKLQKDRGLHTSATLLAGSLDTGSRFLVTKDSEALAQKKYENFKEYLRLYPEFTCVFIGDNGQGDVRAAELVMNDKDIGNLLKRTYIHVVQDLQETYVSDPTIKSYDNDRRICYFNTYVDAAIDAYENGLIRKTGLQRLMIEAVRDFFIIPDDNWSMMNPEIVRPRSYYVRQAQIAAEAAKLAASNNNSSTPSTQLAVANTSVEDTTKSIPGNNNGANTTSLPPSSLSGGRARSDSFSQAVVAALSSLTSSVAKNPTPPTSVSPNANGENSKASNGVGDGYKTPPPQDSPPVPASTLRKTILPPASPSNSSSAVMSQGIAAVKQSVSGNTSTTSALLSASKNIFGGSNNNNAQKPTSGKNTVKGTSTKAITNTAAVGNSAVQASLTFSLLEVWEIHRNRPSLFDGPYKARRKVSGTVKRELRIRELNVSLDHGNRLLLQRDYRHPGSVSPVETIAYPEVFATGRVVATPFGVGVIRHFRSSDGMYEVLIDRTALLRPRSHYVPSSSSSSPSPGDVCVSAGETTNSEQLTESTESAAALESHSHSSSSEKEKEKDASSNGLSGGSIPATSTFTIRLFVPGMALSEIKR